MIWLTTRRTSRLAIAAIFSIGIQAIALADEVEDKDRQRTARPYTTQEERREAGVRYRIADALYWQGLFETEFERPYSKSQTADGQVRRDLESSEIEFAVQLGLAYEPYDWASLEIEYEYVDELNGPAQGRLDEVLIAAELGDIEVELGEFTIPFGEYSSFFAVGPLLEFGEIDAAALSLQFELAGDLDVGLFAFRERLRKLGNGHRKVGWGVVLEHGLSDFGEFTVGYLSNLASSDEEFVDEQGRYRRDVPAVTAHLVVGAGAAEFSAELVAATKRFVELDTNENRPRAYDLEAAWFSDWPVSIALRYEGSRELLDEPRSRYGVSISWQPLRQSFVTVDLLRARFDTRSHRDAESETEFIVTDEFTVAAQLGYEF